jgi:3-oxoacyl-[acyl-carrier protein] reductase
MRRVLVTGSSRGIGRAIAERLAQSGFAVTVHCRASRAQADELAARIGAAVLQFDVAERAAARRALELDLEARGAYY